MRKLYLKSFLGILFFLFLFVDKPQAQTTVQVGNGTSAGATNVFTATSTTTNRYSYNFTIYSAADIVSGGGFAGMITKLAWEKAGTGEYTVNDGVLKIYLKTVNYTEHTTSLETWSDIITGATLVYSSNTFSWPTGTGFKDILLQTPFNWDGASNLAVLVDWYRPSNMSADMTWRYTTATNANKWRIGTAAITDMNQVNSSRANLQLTLIPATPCTSPPVAGTATATPSTVCAGDAVGLNLSGASFGSGQTYVWQSSSSIGGTYTDISSALSTTFYTVNPTATTYYRAAVTCSGNTVYSTPVEVLVNPGLAAGSYSINSGSPTGGTNFQTFADALAAMNCGIAGPIVFNVEPNTSYNEQVIIPEIAGASVVNTITFNGNGAILSDNSTATTGERAVIKLNGADHIVIDSFVINTGAGTYGFGIQLLNDADSNIIRKCVITTSTSSTSTTNYAGILVNSSASSVVGTGDSRCDGNTISGNTVIGGYAGIALVANGATAMISDNKVINNIVQDFYTYGIHINGNDGTVIEGNDISRPVRTSVTTFYGVSMDNISLNTLVSKNRIHNPFDGNLTSTSAAYGVRINACDATVGNENIISNNWIYGFVGGGGTGVQNGILNNSSDNVKFYYNSILLDDASATCNCPARGIYVQSTAVSGIDFRNNTITLGRGGTGAKQAIYMEPTSISNYTVDHNNYYITASGTPVEIANVGGTGFTTLADWQNASGVDQHSLSVNPLFVSSTDLHLQSSSPLDDKGTPVAGVITDIDGEMRDANAPDIGADEMPLSVGLDMKAVALVSPDLGNGCYVNETITIKVKNNSVSPIDFSVNPVTVTVNVTGAATAVYSAIINTGVLAAGATQDVTMSTPSATLNMTASGSYLFNASTSVVGDVNTGNNAMLAAERIKVGLTAGTISSSHTSFCVTGGAPVLTVADADGYSSIQWQQSTTAGTGFTDIPGANVSPYTVGSDITQTMYYRLVATCGAGTQTSAEIVVELYNPEVLTTTPGNRCGPGTVVLGATGSTGTIMKWYDAATGGVPLASGSLFTTPLINSTSTYYVAAESNNPGAPVNTAVGAGATTNATYPNPFYSLWSNTHNQYLVPASELISAGITAGNMTALAVDITSAGTLPMIDLSVKIGTTTATDMSSFVSTSFTTVFTSASLMPVTGLNTMTFSTPFYWDGVSNLVIEVCHGNPSSTTTMSRTARVDNTPYVSTIHTHTTAATGGSTQCGNVTSNVTTYSIRPQFIFTYEPPCESLRVPVLATINTPPAITPSATSPVVCAGQSTQLSVTSPNVGYTYVWNPGNLAGATQTVSPLTSTTYTVTASDNSGGANNGCVNIADVAITVNALPPAVSITPSVAEICTGGDARLLSPTGGIANPEVHFGTQANQNTGSTTAAGYPAPYTLYYGGQRMQMLVTAGELTTAGFTAGSPITAISFPVVSLGANWGTTTTACQNFKVSIGATSLTSLSTFQSGLTEVVAPGNFTPVVGYNNVHAFSTPFVWNGSSNIIIETSFSNNKLGTLADLVTQYNSPTAFQSTIVYRADNMTAAAIASATTVSYSYSARSDFKLISTVSADLTWSPVAGLFTDAAATIPYTGTPANQVYAKPATNQVYTVTATNSSGCSSSGSANVVLVAPPSATISYAGSPYCSNDVSATVTQTGSAGGAYSSTTGLAINASTGAVDISASTPGTYTVTYTIAAGACAQFQTTASVTINAAPAATISYPSSPYCTGGGMAAVVHTGTAGGSYSSSAGLAINATTGEIDLAASTSGTYTVTYTIAASGGCAVYTTTANVVVSNSPSGTISYAGSPYCSNGTTASVTQTGSTGGVYSSTTGLTIDATTGEINLAASTPGVYTVTYFIAAANGCTSFSTTTSVTITPAPAATISYAASPYCTGAGTATVTQTGTAGGTYTSTAGLSVNATSGEINLASSTAGTYTVTYTVAAANGCAVYTTTANVTLTAAPSATISYAGSPYCSNGTTAAVTRTGTTGGTYSSTMGLSLNATTGAVDITNSTPGTYTVTYTVAAANGCSVFTTTANITISLAPSATISYPNSPYCTGGGTAPVTRTGTAGGTYTAAGGLSIDASTGEITLGSSMPGTYTVTYTVAGANGCAAYSTTASVTLSATPSATISYAGSPYCSNAGTAVVTRTGSAGGTYSAGAGLSIHATTGAIDLAASTPGSYIVTYTVTAANGCPTFMATTNVIVTTAPSATISYAGSPYCSSGGTATVTQTGTTGGTYSSTGGLSINTTTGAVNLAASTPGSYTVAYTVAAANGCVAYTTTTNITVTAMPSAAISYTGSPYCGASGIATVTQTGATGGTYSSAAGLSINATTGAVNLGTSTPGTYTVTYTVPAASGCALYTTTATVALTTPGTWIGVANTDWNNAANWCGSIPTAATDVVIPSVAPNMPNLSNGAGDARSIMINTGGALTVGTGGVLSLYGDITGGGSFTATAGSIHFRGAANQSVPAFVATNVTMSGVGGLTLGGNSRITGTLTLTNGNITLGAFDLGLGTTSNGTTTSHIITNGTGNVIVENLAAAQSRTVPVGNDAVSYNPVALIANTGHTADNFTVRVQPGVYENGVSGTTFPTHVVDRTWIINEATPGGSNVNVVLQWVSTQELPSFDRVKSYVMQHNGTDWVTGTPATAAGNDPYAQTKTGVTAFGSFAVQTQPIPQPVTGIYPNPATSYLYVVTDLLSTGPVVFSVFDEKGQVVYRKQETLMVGLNQTRLDIGHLSAGVYVVQVATRLNDKFLVQRFVKTN